jgi:predicted phosphoribosyltransferase
MFHERSHAAHFLVEKLFAYKNSNAVIIAIPRGGVPIGYHVAARLNLPLDVIPCKKMKHPANTNQSIGSVSVDEAIIHENARNVPQDYIYHQIIMLQHSLKAKSKFYKNGVHSPSLRGKTVIVVDDLLKSGDSMLACLKSIKKQKPSKIVVAVPAATTEAAQRLKKEADECIFLFAEVRPGSVPYEKYPTVHDEEVRSLLNKSSVTLNQFVN